MAPPGMKKKPGLVIAVGVGKPKGGPMKPPGMDDDEMPDSPTDEKSDGSKVPREKALVIEEDHRCSNCEHYDATSGECAKVEGYFDPGAACLRYFEPMGDEDSDEPDADDAGGPPDMDADDTQGGM